MNAIFISFNDNHIHFFNSFINSIKHNYKNHPTIIANYEGNNKNIIAKLKKIENLKQTKLINKYGFNTGNIPSNIIFQRFNLWTNQFDSYDNILHLDVDTLVLQPLDQIFEEKKFYICSDRNSHAKVFLDPNDKFLLKTLAEDKIPYSDSINYMANAGVFLIPAEHRTKMHYETLENIANRYHAYCAFADQSIISLWCHFFKIKFHSDFTKNCQIRFLCDPDLTIDIKKISILHFSGEAKYLTMPENKFKNSQTIVDIYEAANAIRFFYRKPRNDADSLKTLKQNLETAYKNHRHQEPLKTA